MNQTRWSLQYVRIGLFICVLFVAHISYAQLQNESGSQLILNGNVQLVLNNLDLENNGQLNCSNDSKVVMKGSAFTQNIDVNNTTISNLIIQRSFDNFINITGNLRIENSLVFENNFNFISLIGGDLILAQSAGITDADSDNAIFTNNHQLIKEQMGTFTFPLAISLTKYMPITLTQNGAIDDIGVSTLEEAYENGTGGNAYTEGVVQGAWQFTEAVAGGNDLTATVQWNVFDEQADFDRSDCLIAFHDSQKWDGLLINKGTSTGNNPYTRTRANLQGSGVLAVGSDKLFNPLRLDCDLLLRGAYESGGSMRDQIRLSATFPTNEPFTALGFNHLLTGGGESIDPSILNTNGNDAIVDWVFVELRTNTDNSSKVATRAALLQKDGDIVDLDGTSTLCFKGLEDNNYHVGIRHRNHIGLLSLNALPLSHNSTSLDFKTTSANVLGGLLALEDLGDGFFAIPTGDYDHNGQVQNSDNAALLLDLGLSGYRQGDLDLNGQIQNSDIQNFLIPFIGRGTQFNY